MDSLAIEKKYDLQAPVKKVFDALTKDVSKWWKSDYLIGGDKVKRLVCEAKLGGKMYEVWGAGEGSIWGTVTEIQKNVRLEICGTIGNTGASWGKLGYDFEPNGKNAMSLKFRHDAIGKFEEGTGDEYNQGWDQIFAELKAFVERPAKRR